MYLQERITDTFPSYIYIPFPSHRGHTHGIVGSSEKTLTKTLELQQKTIDIQLFIIDYLNSILP